MNGNNLNMNNNQVQDYINNGRINLNARGNQGRYTRSNHFQTLEEWDSIFSHLSVSSGGSYPTGIAGPYSVQTGVSMRQCILNMTSSYTLYA